MLQRIASISEFLLQAGTEYRVFDFGRGIRPLAEQQFLDIENGELPAPFPRQQHMWLGIVYWNKQHQLWLIGISVGMLISIAIFVRIFAG